MSDDLKHAIRESGETLYRIAKDSGIGYATLHRFMKGERDITSPSMDRLCKYLGLRLTK